MLGTDLCEDTQHKKLVGVGVGGCGSYGSKGREDKKFVQIGMGGPRGTVVPRGSRESSWLAKHECH